MTYAVLYASRNGRTKAFAERISAGIGGDLIDLRTENAPDVSAYDTVILGSGVYSGKPTRIVKFAKDNAETLSGKKIFMFLCCLYNGEKGDMQLETVASGIPHLSGKTYFSERSEDNERKLDDFLIIVS